MEEDDMNKVNELRSVPHKALPETPNNGQNSQDKCSTPFKEPPKEGYSNDIIPKKREIPKGFKESMGRLARLPVEERKAIAAKGGSAKAAVGKGKPYSKCIICELRTSCKRAFEESHKKGWSDEHSRCVYEIEGRHQLRDLQLKDYRAFISSDPVDLLAKIQTTFKMLEDEVERNPSYTKLTNLLYLMMNIYRLKFGEKAFVMSVNKNIDANASMDIKSIMKEMRREQSEINAIDMTPHPVSKKAEPE